jgi:hypothetical protein
MVTYGRFSDCNLRRRRGNEIRQRKPSDARDAQDRGQYPEHIPTIKPQLNALSLRFTGHQ